MLATGGVILTTAGSLLISRSLELVKPIEFTHMKIGTGDISSIAQARKLNDLVISYKNINMSTLVRSGDLVRVRGSFTNDEITETVRIKEVGVFAKIGTEQPILFGYVNDGEGELIPPGTSGVIARTRDLYIGITGEAEVAITINKSLVYATIEDLEEGLNRKEDKFDKKSGWNLEKTDLTENDSNKVFTPKGALNLFNTLTTNFTNGINAAKEVLRLDIVKKLNKGAYLGDAQDLKNDIDMKVSKSGDIINGKVSVDSSFTPLISLAIGDQDTGFNAIADGNVEIRGNNNIHGNITQAGVNFLKGKLTIDGEHPYRPGNKPTPSDIGAISKEGNGSINGRLFVDNKNSPNQPAISLAIGDNDSGFDWLSDGTIRYVSNGVAKYNMYNVFAIETCSVEQVGGDTYIMKYPNGTMFLSMSVTLTEQVGGTYNQFFNYPASFKEGTIPNVVGKNTQFCATHIAGVEGADNRGFRVVGNRSMNVRIQAMGVYK